MSVLAPVTEPTAAELAAQLRAALARAVDRIARERSITSCTGLDAATEAALYRYARFGDGRRARRQRVPHPLGGAEQLRPPS